MLQAAIQQSMEEEGNDAGQAEKTRGCGGGGTVDTPSAAADQPSGGLKNDKDAKCDAQTCADVDVSNQVEDDLKFRCDKTVEIIMPNLETANQTDAMRDARRRAATARRSRTRTGGTPREFAPRPGMTRDETAFGDPYEFYERAVCQLLRENEPGRVRPSPGVASVELELESKPTSSLKFSGLELAAWELDALCPIQA